LHGVRVLIAKVGYSKYIAQENGASTTPTSGHMATCWEESTRLQKSMW